MTPKSGKYSSEKAGLAQHKRVAQQPKNTHRGRFAVVDYYEQLVLRLIFMHVNKCTDYLVWAENNS